MSVDASYKKFEDMVETARKNIDKINVELARKLSDYGFHGTVNTVLTATAVSKNHEERAMHRTVEVEHGYRDH